MDNTQSASPLMTFGSRQVDLSRPQVMGILNVTPDSFSDGGRFNRLDDAMRQAERMVAAGARFVDVGGESTRPGAAPVSPDQELARVCPVVEKLAANLDVVISVDTSTAPVMTESVRLGAALINDVRSLTREGALQAAVAAQVPVCLMHMQGEPGVMQVKPHYEDVVREVSDFLRCRSGEVQAAGVANDRILIDPGFGFGKTVEHNLRLLQGLPQLAGLGWPLLVGLSRKSLLQAITGRAVGERLSGSLALATIAATLGAGIIRVHDVPETVDAMKVVAAFQSINQE